MSRKKSNQITSEQNKISKKIKSLMLIAVLALSTLTFAQPGFGDEGDDVDDEVAAASIDTNILVLLAAGIVLGVTFIKKNETLSTYKK